MVLRPARDSEKWAYTGDKVTMDSLFSSLGGGGGGGVEDYSVLLRSTVHSVMRQCHTLLLCDCMRQCHTLLLCDC